MMGANMVFIVRLTENAVRIFVVPSGPERACSAASMPSRCRMAGAPAEKIMKAAEMATPRQPHTTARGMRPKPAVT